MSERAALDREREAFDADVAALKELGIKVRRGGSGVAEMERR